MNKKEFISELKRKLNSLPKEESQNVINYYEEYFDEAGSENEQKVIEELGSPSNIASQMIVNFALKNKKSVSSIWLILLAIFASPIALPLAFAFVMVLFAIVIALFAVIFAIGITSFTLVITGIVSALAGIVLLVQHVQTSIFMFGVGLLCTGLRSINNTSSYSFDKEKFYIGC